MKKYQYMKVRFLPLLLAVCMLFEQTTLFAQAYRPYEKKLPVYTLQTPADHTALAIEKEAKRQIALASDAVWQARRLDRQARLSLRQENLPAFLEQEKQLNDLLVSQLKAPLVETRLFALEMLLAHMQEGLILRQDAARAFLILEEQLQTQKKCQGKECEALGLSALLLSAGLFTQRPLVLPQDEPVRADANLRRHLTDLYFSLLQNDYGSVQANNALAPYLLRALGYAGGAGAVKRAEDFLIEQSKRIRLLWGAAGISGSRWHLNHYNVGNLPAQKAAMQVLAGLGPDGKKVLEYYAAQNRGLAAYTHANIELAYLGSSSVAVQENLQNLYCNQVWNLKADADFELKKQLGYAYGQGRKPAYVYAAADAKTCRVIVPSQPDPRLKNAELTQRLMGEILFIGGGEFLNILLQAKRVRLALQALKSKWGRQIAGVSAHTAKTAPKPLSFKRPAALAAAGEPTAHTARTGQTVRAAAGYLEQDKTVLLNSMQDLSHTASLSSGQQNHLKYLQGKLTNQPVTTYSLNEIKKDFSALSSQKYNAFTVFGDEMDSYAYLTDEMRRNFMVRDIGFPMDGSAPLAKITPKTLQDELLQYGKLSDDIFVRWNMHGNLQNEIWRSYLKKDSFMNMEEIASLFQQVIQSGSAKTVTLYLDSCFPGAAFNEFLKLPASLKHNINLFAPGGWRELRYNLPSGSLLQGQTPLAYAKQIWKQNLSVNSLAGKAYVNGKIYSPLASAAKLARSEGRTLYAGQLQGLLALSEASSNERFFEIMDGLKDLGLPVFQKGTEKAVYMFLPKPNMIIEHKGAYQITLPDYLVYQVGTVLDGLPF